MDARYSCRSRADFSLYGDENSAAGRLAALIHRMAVPTPISKSGNGLVEYLQHRQVFRHCCNLREKGTLLQSIPVVAKLRIAKQKPLRTPEFCFNGPSQPLNSRRVRLSEDPFRQLAILSWSHSLDLVKLSDHVGCVTESSQVTDRVQF